MMTPEHQQLATLVYIHAMKKQIEEEVRSKYLKRIEHLVGANNELMYELEQRELELVTIESELVTVEKECYGRGSMIGKIK
jgi:hypothetical protein